MIKTIALSGHMGSGKDTAADMIMEEVVHSKSYAFADHLKKIAIEIFGCTEAEVYGDEKEKVLDVTRVFDVTKADEIFQWVREKNPSYDRNCFARSVKLVLSTPKSIEFKTSRELQQFIGTELLRDCYAKSYHIDQVVYRIGNDKPALAVITDARFPNERAWAREYGAKTVLIEGRSNAKLGSFNKHASETGFGKAVDYDYVIDNSGSLENLKSCIMSVVCNL